MPTQMFRKTYAVIDLDAYEYNIKVIREQFPKDIFFCPMIKANAYGHGDIVLARALEELGEKHVGVCLIEEGIRLRRAGIKLDILIFRGFDREGAKEIVNQNLTPVIGTWDQLDNIIEFSTKKTTKIHLKFNTGMNRLGFAPEEAPLVFERIKEQKGIALEGVLTHFFNGEDAHQAKGNSATQLEIFDKICSHFQSLNPICHCLNSAAAIHKNWALKNNQNSHPLLMNKNWGIRPGLALYGVNPVKEQSPLLLKPVFSLKSHASIFHDLEIGESVSYNATWVAKRKSKVAIVPIGYADGYFRVLSNKIHALYNGKEVPVVGNVCMDFLMLDITDVACEQLDQKDNCEVVLFGNSHIGTSLDICLLSQKASTIPWEIMTSVSERVPRLYVGRLAKIISTDAF